MNIKEDLKPCPFCGGMAELRIVGNEFTKSKGAMISCSRCHIKKTVKVIYRSMDWARGRVIISWNTRAALDAANVADEP